MRPAAAKLKEWRENPRSFFYGEIKMTPEPWLDEFIDHLPSQDHKEKQLALKACTGAGKSAALGAAQCWFAAVFGGKDKTDHPIGIVTAIDEKNLKSGIWKEMAVWRSRSQALIDQFELTSTKLSQKDNPDSWYVEARTWAKKADPEAQGRAMSGVHGKYVMATLDECGDIPPPLLRVAKQIFSSEHEWAKILLGGNPTSTTGALYTACVDDRDVTHVITITADPDNPRRGKRTDIENARKQIKKYGRDNPWVKTTILGEFPEAAINALLGIEDIEAAMNRILEPADYSWAQKRLGVDVSRFGNDPTCLFGRQGLRALKPVEMRHTRKSRPSVDIANRVLLTRQKWHQELTLLDSTGGWAAGARDILLTAGVPIMDIQYHAPAPDRRYKNMRAYIHWNGAEWIKGGGWLPNVPEMVQEFIATTYSFVGGQMLMEPKELVKERIGRSPNYADSFYQTFAIPDMPGDMMEGLMQKKTDRAKAEWNPYEEEASAMAKTDWNPHGEI